MSTQRIATGPDAHPRSIRATAPDTHAGESLEAKPGGNEAVTTWITRIIADHGPVAVTNEAGPNGFSLARTLAGMNYPVSVAAPSKPLRPPGTKPKRMPAMLSYWHDGSKSTNSWQCACRCSSRNPPETSSGHVRTPELGESFWLFVDPAHESAERGLRCY